MLRQLVAVLAAALLLQPVGADARGSHGGSHSTRSSSSSHSTSTRSTSNRSSHSTRSSDTHSTSHHSRSGGTRSTVHHSRSERTTHTKRDPAQRRAFQKSHPCPSTGKTSGACPGYVVDHVKPLKRGGLDRPSNMQWQTTAEAKAKDKVE